MSYSDQEILKLLETDREKGAVALLEAYTGLLWSVCARRVKNPEDIKECVNDVFADFCLNWKRYAEEKGSLGSYLAVMADRQALDKYRQNERQLRKEEDLKNELRAAGEPEEYEVLEEALGKLEPMDEKIIRMKYYDGLSYKEIASRMALPYETVKKRGRRSISKLLKLMLVLILIALLAACAIGIIRYFQFLPGVGFNWNEDKPSYRLSEIPPSCVVDGITFTVTDAVYHDGLVTLEVMAYSPHGLVRNEDLTDQIWEQERDIAIVESHIASMSGEGLTRELQVGPYQEAGAGNELKTELTFRGQPEETGDTLKLSLSMPARLNTEGKKEVQFRVHDEEYYVPITDAESAFELVLSRAAFEEELAQIGSICMAGDYSFVVQPGTVDGEGVVLPLYQLYSDGKYRFSSLLVNNFRGMGSYETEDVTLTAEDGSVYTAGRIQGDNAGYRDEIRMFFPEVPAGRYRLHLPYICLDGSDRTEPVTVPLPQAGEQEVRCDVKVLFPDGAGFHITGLRRLNDEYGTVSIGDKNSGIIYKQGWCYLLECEPVQAGELTFCTALCEPEFRIPDRNLETFIPMTCSEVGGKLYIACDYEDMLEEVSLVFYAPVYVLEQEFELDVNVK